MTDRITPSADAIDFIAKLRSENLDAVKEDL